MGLSISTVKAKLCWITFSNARIVGEIFRLTMINGNTSSFNAFPHIPAKAMSRKESIELILKRVQAINKQLRYQVRMGDDDLIVKVKNHRKDDYSPYVSVPIKDIDPNETVEDWELVTLRKESVKPGEGAKNPFDWQTKKGKRGASQSPEDSRKPKRNNRDEVDDWQVAEYLHCFIEGTVTKPNYANLIWGEEAANSLGEAEEAGDG